MVTESANLQNVNCHAACDRSVPPVYGTFRMVEIPSMEVCVLENGMRISYRRTPVDGLVRVDMVVRAGSAFQPRPLVAQLSNLLLKEGCRNSADENGKIVCKAMNAAEVADYFDGYGAYVYYSTMMEYVIVTLCTPTKYIRENLTLLRNLHAFPQYPEEGLRLNLQLREQQWRIDREKVHVMASMKMNEVLFGQDHPYGKMLCEEDFQTLDTQALHDFHDRFHTPENTQIVVTGDVNKEVLGCIESLFGLLESCGGPAGQMNLVPPQPSSQKVWSIPKKGASQAAIRFSIPTIGENHPDFHGLHVLNALLGGYFGSRLMMSLRERKGYTYSIYSTHTVYNNFSYIDIDTQTAVGNVRPVIDGVWEEMERLSAEQVSDEELNRLRSYLYGEYARMLDGPFSLSDIFVSSLVSGQDMTVCHKQQLEVLGNITPGELQHLAEKYLRAEEFYIVSAGVEE